MLAKDFQTMTQRTPSSKNINENITQMGLQNMLSKTDFEHLGLTDTQRQVLSSLISFVNGGRVGAEGIYVAFPSIPTIEKRTGYKERSIQTNLNALKQEDWIRVVSGNGRGKSNHYFINARKVIEAYNASNPRNAIAVPRGKAFDAIQPTTSTHTRNTNNLRQGQTQGLASPQPSIARPLPASSGPHWAMDDEDDDDQFPAPARRLSGTLLGMEFLMKAASEPTVEDDEELDVPF